MICNANLAHNGETLTLTRQLIIFISFVFCVFSLFCKESKIDSLGEGNTVGSLYISIKMYRPRNDFYIKAKYYIVIHSTDIFFHRCNVKTLFFFFFIAFFICS